PRLDRPRPPSLSMGSTKCERRSHMRTTALLAILVALSSPARAETTKYRCANSAMRDTSVIGNALTRAVAAGKVLLTGTCEVDDEIVIDKDGVELDCQGGGIIVSGWTCARDADTGHYCQGVITIKGSRTYLHSCNIDGNNTAPVSLVYVTGSS